MDDISQDNFDASSFSGFGEDENNTQTCAATSLNFSTSTSENIASRVFHSLYFLIVLLVGTFLNVLVAVLVAMSKKLRTRAFAIAVQIVLANLGTLTTYVLPAMIQIIHGRQLVSSDLCIVIGYFAHAFEDVRILLVCVFSLDHFASVFAPFFYPKHNLKIILISCILTWSVPTIVCIIGAPQILDCYKYRKADSVCYINISCSLSCKIFQITYMLAILYPAMVMSFVFIVALYIKGKKIRQKESEMIGLPKNQITSSDWKALKTFLLLALNIVAVQVEIGLSLILSDADDLLHNHLILLISDTLSIHLFLDPIVILKNSDAREALKALWKSKTSLKCNQNNGLIS